MGAKVIVAMGCRDEFGEVISCLENLTRPGMTVIFLVRYSVEFWPYIRDHWVATESVRAAAKRGRENLAKYSWNSQQELADGKFSGVREALGNRGVAVKLEFYSGRLKAALQEYSVDAQVLWIVRPTARRKLFAPLLDLITAHFRSLRSTEIVPSWGRFRVAYRRETHKRTC